MDAVDLQITSADENHDVERSSGGDDQFVKRAGPDVQRHLTAPVSRLRETRGDAQKQLKVRRTTYRLSTAAKHPGMLWVCRLSRGAKLASGSQSIVRAEDGLEDVRPIVSRRLMRAWNAACRKHFATAGHFHPQPNGRLEGTQARVRRQHLFQRVLGVEKLCFFQGVDRSSRFPGFRCEKPRDPFESRGST